MRLPDDDGSDFALPQYTLLFYSTQTQYGVTTVILTTLPLRTNTSSVSCNALPILVVLPVSFHRGSTERELPCAGRYTSMERCGCSRPLAGWKLVFSRS